MNKSDEFSYKIECIVADHGISFMDAIVEYCENNNIEIEVAAQMINSSLRSKIEMEAEKLRLIPKINRLEV